MSCNKCKSKACRALCWTAGIFVLLLAVCAFAGNFMVKYALQPKDLRADIEGKIAGLSGSYPGLTEWVDSLFADGTFKDTTMLTDAGDTLHAWYAANFRPGEWNLWCVRGGDPLPDFASKKTAVIVHGYTSSPASMMMIARMYRDSLGYNVILPHLYGHGISGGNAARMGWLDRLDVEKWMEIAHGIFADTLQVVHGISMGGATTMMVSGDVLPEYVRGFVDDCGYTSVWDQFKKELREDYHLGAFPVLYAADIVCRIRFGWGFKEASSVKQLAKCKLPMLFIHGDSDDFVPTDMVYVNYEAKTTGYRDIWVVPDTDHANSYRNHPDEYVARVREFLAGQVE